MVSKVSNTSLGCPPLARRGGDERRSAIRQCALNILGAPKKAEAAAPLVGRAALPSRPDPKPTVVMDRLLTSFCISEVSDDSLSYSSEEDKPARPAGPLKMDELKRRLEDATGGRPSRYDAPPGGSPTPSEQPPKPKVARPGRLNVDGLNEDQVLEHLRKGGSIGIKPKYDD